MDSLIIELSRSVERVEIHPVIRFLYSHDLLKIPKPLDWFVRRPVCVVQPKNDIEVLSVLKFCRKHKIPIVPRGAATSAYGGAVTIKPSVVVDFTRMRNVEVRKEERRVVAESGAVWLDVEKVLNSKGLALRVYPSSAPASTVGGWIAQGGYGIGSLKYGSIADNIEWLEIADFEGVRRVEGEEISNFVGLFGTTGLIIRACLKLRDNVEIRSVSVEMNFDKAIEVLEGAYHASFINSGLSRLMGLNGDVLLLSYEGEVFHEGDPELGRRVWENRFNLFKAARETEVLVTEAILPYQSSAEFYEKMKDIPMEAVFTKDGVVFLGLIPVKGYYSSALRAVKFVKVAEKFGGRSYATGLLFPHKGLADAAAVDYKRKVDPENLLNPGKALQANPISRIIRAAEMIL